VHEVRLGCAHVFCRCILVLVLPQDERHPDVLEAHTCRWQRTNARRSADEEDFFALMSGHGAKVAGLDAEGLHGQLLKSAQQISAARPGQTTYNKKILELIQVRADLELAEKWKPFVAGG
jgi:hypothetical protein